MCRVDRFDEHARAELEARRDLQAGHDPNPPVVRIVTGGGCVVDDDVVRRVGEDRGEPTRRVTQHEGDVSDVGVRRVSEPPPRAEGRQPHLEAGARTPRAPDRGVAARQDLAVGSDRTVVVLDEPVGGREAREGRDDRRRDEVQREHLRVRVGDGSAGCPALVHDDLHVGVPRSGVGPGPVAEHVDELDDLGVVEPG